MSDIDDLDKVDWLKQWKESIPRDPKKRAVVPYLLGLSICKALEREYSVLL